jgi:hypothetical protein
MPIERPIAGRVLELQETLIQVLPPKSISDRTCYHNLLAWVRRALQERPDHNRDLCDRIVGLAVEAENAPVDNPRAFFMSLLKRDLGYRPANANRMSKSTTQNAQRR